jgi:hypothetical protein
MHHQLRGVARLIAIVQVFREVRMSLANPMCRPGNNDTLVAVDVMDLTDLVGLLQAAPQSRWQHTVGKVTDSMFWTFGHISITTQLTCLPSKQKIAAVLGFLSVLRSLELIVCLWRNAPSNPSRCDTTALPNLDWEDGRANLFNIWCIHPSLSTWQ